MIRFFTFLVYVLCEEYSLETFTGETTRLRAPQCHLPLPSTDTATNRCRAGRTRCYKNIREKRSRKISC